MPEPAPLPRREFARVLAAGVSGYALRTAETAAAQEPAKPPVLVPPPEALILTQIVADCPSEHWNEDTLASVLGDIRGDIARGKTLRSVPLINADEPGPMFAAYRSPAKG
jgi:hypothetical protein